MFTDYYKLTEHPFQITADSKFSWLGEKHAEALATLEYGVEENKGFLALTGDVGTGKTLMVNCLLKRLDTNIIAVNVPNPRLAPVDLYNFISAKFGWERKFNTKGGFLLHLEDYLYHAHSENKKVVLIIDEAQSINKYVFEDIRLLSNIELEYKKLINIFIVGQIELEKILNEERNKALRERIAIWYHIDPLTENETRQYISYRLVAAGSENEIFKPNAIREIFLYSRGIPRQINILCDQALLAGFSSDIQEIDSDLIRECAEDLRMSSYTNKKEKSALKIVEKKPLAGDSVPTKTRLPTKQIFASLSVILLMILCFFIYSMKTLSKEGILGKRFQANTENIPTLEKKTIGLEELKTKIHTDNYDFEKPHAELKEETLVDVPSNLKNDSQVNQKNKNLFAKMNLVVYFKHNSFELHDKAVAKLDRIFEFMRNNSETKIKAQGYTDNSGDLDHNLFISNFRASIIKSYLVSKGIHNSRIEAKGMGSANPIASNEILERKRLNHRVEIKFYGKNSM